jgi:hypothetical protein
MMKNTRRAILLLVVALIAFGGALSCGADFDPKNKVTNVRILAAKADIPYAKPGEAVHVEALAHDGRKDKPEPMKIYWFPAPCMNPPGDAYFACYALINALYPVGTDLTPVLKEGKDVTITIPPDALKDVQQRPGQTGEKFGTAFVFMVACAGHVVRVPPPSGQAANALPVGCVNSRGERLSPEDFVLGFTRVYVFEQRRNELPVIDGITFNGNPIDVRAGITATCEKQGGQQQGGGFGGGGAGGGTCKNMPMSLLFDDKISETDPENVDVDGKVGRETIFVDWFTTVGKFTTDRKILFDGNLGRPKKPENDLEFPKEVSDGQAVKGTVFAILHDNRGGTSWLEIPIDLQPAPTP